MIKPRIKRDVWDVSGWLCSSKESPCGRRIAKRITGSGETIQKAYEDWRLRREDHYNMKWQQP